MPGVNPFLGLFAAIATLMTAFFAPVFVLPIDHGERLTRIEARFETRMNELDTRMDDLGATVAATNERMARIEGTVAGALGRPFAERMAEGLNNLAQDG